MAGIMLGSTGIFVRTLTANGIDSITLLFTHFSISAILMLLIIFDTNKDLLKINKDDVLLLIFCGLFILCLNLCYNNSINALTLSLASVLLCCAQIFVIVFSYFLFAEKISRTKLAVVFLVISGCILVSGLFENSIIISLVGIINGIGSAIFWALYTVTSRKSIDDGIHTFTILFYGLVVITLVSIPFTNFGQINNYIFSDFMFNCAFLILHALFSFTLPYVFITISLSCLEVGTTSILSSCGPVAAMVFGVIFYSETPSLLMILGLLITMFALFLLSRDKTNT